MEFGKFKYFITWHPIAIERAVPLEKFLYFIKETQKTGVLPEFTKQELINIRNYIKRVRPQDLVELRDKVLEEIKVNAVSIPQDNFKKYIIYMEEELEPILTSMDEFNLFSLIRTENLYPMPLSFSDNDLWKGNTFDEWRKLDAIPLSKMENYTDNERDIYRYLERLFEVSMSHCMHFYEVKDFIEILKTKNIQSATASKGVISETDKYDIIDLGKVFKSYNEFNNDLFEVNIADYLACFNLSIPDPTYPIFKPGKQTNFVYFLSQIPNVKKMDKIALSRFGIDYYYQQKGKANPNQVFKNKVATIFK
jgi:hypothetical protein